MLNVKNYKVVSPVHKNDESFNSDKLSELDAIHQEISKKNEIIDLREQQIEEIKLNLQETQEKLTIKEKNLEESQQNLNQLKKALNNSQRKVETSIQQLRTIVESAPASIALFDKHLRYMSASQQWLKDYKIDYDVVGKCHYDVIPEVPQHWKDVHYQCLRGEIKRNPGEKLIKQDGSIQWVKWEVHPWYLDQKVQGLVMMTEDITEQKRLEDKLGTSQTTYESLLNSIPDLIIRIDKNFNFLGINDKCRNTFKILEESIFGKNVYDINLPKDLIQYDLPKWQDAINTKSPITYYSDLIIDHKKLYFQVKVVPELDIYQEIDSLFIIYTDITQLRESENLIRSSQSKYKTLVKHLPHRVLRFDTSLRLIYDNHRNDILSAISGYHLIGLPLQEMGLEQKDRVIFEENLPTKYFKVKNK